MRKMGMCRVKTEKNIDFFLKKWYYFNVIQKGLNMMFAVENKSNNYWSAVKSFAACFLCAKKTSADSVCGTVLVAVPFFVFFALISPFINIISIIIMGIMIALPIILKVQCCRVSKTTYIQSGFGI